MPTAPTIVCPPLVQASSPGGPGWPSGAPGPILWAGPPALPHPLPPGQLLLEIPALPPLFSCSMLSHIHLCFQKLLPQPDLSDTGPPALSGLLPTSSELLVQNEGHRCTLLRVSPEPHRPVPAGQTGECREHSASERVRDQPRIRTLIRHDKPREQTAFGVTEQDILMKKQLLFPLGLCICISVYLRESTAVDPRKE